MDRARESKDPAGGWAAELVALLEELGRAAARGTVEAAAIARAAALVPARPSSKPLLDQLLELARLAGDPRLPPLVEAKRAVALAAGAPAPACLEADLLVRLLDKPIGREVRTLYVVGAHRYQERALLERVFPELERVVLFEPNPQLLPALEAEAARDPRVIVLPWAVADRCGTATFHLTDNDAASSSLLSMKRHRELFPHVHEIGSIEVPVRTLPAAMAERGLPAPEALMVDVQGAEYRVLAAMGDELRRRLLLVYTEASTEEVYEGARPLAEVAELLREEFQLVGFEPLSPDVPSHGNALFVRRGWVKQALVPAGAAR